MKNHGWLFSRAGKALLAVLAPLLLGISQTATAQPETLSAEQAGDEMLLMGLRLREGLDLNRYRALSGRAPDPARIETLSDQGMIEVPSAGKIRATAAGWPVLDTIVASLSA